MAGAGAVNRTPSPAPGPGVWPGIIGRDHHIWPGPGAGMGINPPPAPGIHGAGNPGRFLLNCFENFDMGIHKRLHNVQVCHYL